MYTKIDLLPLTFGGALHFKSKYLTCILKHKRLQDNLTSAHGWYFFLKY